MKLSNKIACAALLVACSATTAVAGTTAFDFLGVDRPVYSLDWDPGNALAKNSLPLSFNPYQPTYFDLYYQATLGSFKHASAPSTAVTSTYEITTQIQFSEYGFGSGPFPANANFFLDQTKQSYVKMYYDDFTSGVRADNLAGTGFNDGDLFLSGSVVGLLGSNFAPTIDLFDIDKDGNTAEVVTGALDQFGNNDWVNTQTVYGTGGTSVIIKVDQINQDRDVILGVNNFDLPFPDYLILNLAFNTSNNLPFGETDPSRLFTNMSDGSTFSPNLGAINGQSGPDFIFQADANSSFASAVPEPSTFALAGAGLLFLGACLRRRSK